jgi:hypothetical protein
MEILHLIGSAIRIEAHEPSVRRLEIVEVRNQ